MIDLYIIENEFIYKLQNITINVRNCLKIEYTNRKTW